MKLFRTTLTTALAALLVSATLFTSPVIAQDKMGGKMDDKMGSKMDGKMGGKMDDKMGGKMAGPVFVSKSTKMAYTPAQAKTMAMKDKMGVKLVKMTKLPAGYKMAPSKMGDKMGGKMGDKMGGKMDDKMGGKMGGTP
ncbi:MAG: hypothetical protein H7145_25145 [Akkermansiaceae bacterium]|nr:hypothetical protein [Armatimonadota bacterium]